MTFQYKKKLSTNLGLVAFLTAVAVEGSLIRMGPHVLTDVSDGLVELATLSALVPPLAEVDLHVLLQQVARQELLLTLHTLEGLVACSRGAEM